MRNKLHTSVVGLCLMASLLFGPSALAQDQAASQAGSTSVPNLIRYSGTLKNIQGAASVAPATVGVTFSIYKQQDGGAPVWQEVQNVTPDASGQYNVLLGNTTATGLPDDLFSQQEQRWLSVQVQGQEEQPRVLLVSVPYAFKAHEAETLGGLPASAFMKAPTADSTSTSAETGAALTGLSAVGAGGTTSQTAGTLGKSKAPCPPGTNHIMYWDATNDICPSAITQDPGNGNIGIGLPSNVQASEPLDVQGAISTYTWYDINEKRMLSVGNTGTANDASTNLFLGWNTGAANSGDTNNNTFVGRDAGPANTTGHDNTFSGYQAGNANVGGNDPAGSDNTFTGSQAGLLNKTGFLNTFSGYTAGYGNTTGFENSCFGSAACLHNLTGAQNVALGTGAGFRNMDGSANVYVGFDSGWGLSGVGSRGSNNTMTGWETGYDNFGSNNVFYGYKAGFSNTTGNSNIAIGAGAGSTAGATNSNNIYIGNPGTNETSPAIRIGVQGSPYHVNQTYIAGIVTNLFPPNSGASVVLIDATGHLGVSGASLGGPVTGSCSLGVNFLTKWTGSGTVGCTHVWENTAANYFVGIGPAFQAGTMNSTAQLQVDGDIDILHKDAGTHYQITEQTVLSIDGTNNLFTGVGAGTASGSTSRNTFSGFNAGNVNTADENTYTGYRAGASNTTGARNVFIGSEAGASNTTGGGNTTVGALAGMNADGCCSTFVGHGAGQNTTVGGNQFFGYRAGGSTTTGFANVFTGYFTGFANTTGTYNAFYGVNTGITNDTGSMNSFFGVGAGSQSNVTGSSNIYIGFNAGNGAGAGNSNNIYLGSPGANESGAIRIGLEGSQAAQTYIAGIWSHPTNGTVPTFVTIDNQGHLGYDTPMGGGGGNVIGPGNCAANFLTRWNGGNNVDCSHVWETQNGTFFVGINTTAPARQLDVNGEVNTATHYEIQDKVVVSIDGQHNTLLGDGPSSSGDRNTIVGNLAGATGGGSNDAYFGYEAGVNSTGAQNTFLGAFAGLQNATGHDNTFVGYGTANSFTSGSGNIFLGSGAGNNNTTSNNDIYLANSNCAYPCTENNTTRIGASQTDTYIAGIYSSSVGGKNAAVCIDSTGKLGTTGCNFAATQKQETALESQQNEIQSLLSRVNVQQQEIESLKSQLQLQNAAFQERLSRLESLLSTQVASTSRTSLAASAPNGGQ